MPAPRPPVDKPHFKYTDWAQRFRERILSGDLKPGARLPSQNDLYALHGLSTATSARVYQILEREGLVTREHRRGVFVAEQPVQEHAVDTICVICEGFGECDQHPYYAQLIAQIYRLAEQDGMRTMLCSGSTLPRWDHIGGVLLLVPRSDRLRLYAKRIPAHIPIVSVLADDPHMASVVADEYSGVRAATQHLLQLGHQRIGMLAMRIGQVLRSDAYQETLRAAGIEPRPEWLRVMPQQEEYCSFVDLGRRYMKEWLDQDWAGLGCTALLCHNDDTAAGVLQALGEAGIRVPEELALVGFDGTSLADSLTPRLTTIQMPLERMAQRGWEQLRARSHPLQGERPDPETIVLPTKLRVAESTAPQP
jgi:DNA-binding LacI/PurR family transcriptional regulator